MLSVLFIYVRSHLDLWIAMRAMMKEDEGYTPPPTLLHLLLLLLHLLLHLLLLLLLLHLLLLHLLLHSSSYSHALSNVDGFVVP